MLGHETLMGRRRVERVSEGWKWEESGGNTVTGGEHGVNGTDLCGLLVISRGVFTCSSLSIAEEGKGEARKKGAPVK